MGLIGGFLVRHAARARRAALDHFVGHLLNQPPVLIGMRLLLAAVRLLLSPGIGGPLPGGARSRQSLARLPGPVASWRDGSRRVLGHDPSEPRHVAVPGGTEASRRGLAVDAEQTVKRASLAVDGSSERPK
jgi:hypothetical protein